MLRKHPDAPVTGERGSSTNVEIKVTETPDDLINLTSLWQKYIEFKRKYWSPTTYANSGLVFAKRFSNLKNQDLRFPQKIQQELFENFSMDAVKRSCIQIKAAINWGLQERIISNLTSSPA